MSVVWSGTVGTVAVWSATGLGSLSLLGFGVDAVVDAAASVALIWRFLVEARQPSRAERVERAAETVVGVALLVLSAYLVAASTRALIDGHLPAASGLATAILVASVVLLPPIALLKYRIAGQLASRALRGDSILTAVAAALAGISLIGMSAASGLGWWWADAVAALIVAAVMVREGVKSLAMSRRSQLSIRDSP